MILVILEGKIIKITIKRIKELKEVILLKDQLTMFRETRMSIIYHIISNIKYQLLIITITLLTFKVKETNLSLLKTSWQLIGTIFNPHQLWIWVNSMQTLNKVQECVTLNNNTKFYLKKWVKWRNKMKCLLKEIIDFHKIIEYHS